MLLVCLTRVIVARDLPGVKSPSHPQLTFRLNPNELPEVVERVRALEAAASDDDIFDRFSTLAARTMRTPIALVSFLRNDDQIIKGLEGTLPEPWHSERRTPLKASLCQHVQATGEPLMICDASEHPLVRDSPTVTQLGVRAYLGVPLKTADGYVLGAFCVIDYQSRIWTAEDEELLRSWASLIMIEIDLRLGRRELLNNFAVLQADANRRDERTRLLVHDLRTPLNSLLLGLRTLPMLGDLNPDQTESLQLALRGGKTLVQLVDDLLDADAAEAKGAASLQISSGLDAAQLMAQAVSQVAALAAHRGLSLSIEATMNAAELPEPVTFDADMDKTLRALVNLLSNAVKFTPARGKIGIAARTEKGTAGEYAVFAVRDTGMGIAPENLKRIFERYVHLDSSEMTAQRSSGLGLAFVKAVAEAHGGRVEVESVVGEGSTFALILPRHQALRSLG